MHLLGRLSMLLAASVLVAAPAAGQLRAQFVTTGFTNPVAIVQDPTQPHVQFVVQQNGRIRPLVNGVISPDFLNLSGSIVSGGEQGLLGLAFAPDYATSRRFFVNFTNPQGHTVIARFLRDPANPLLAVPSSRVDLVWPDGQAFIAQPFENHNGGNVMFGPDGYLYIGMGDGGSGGDPGNRAQNPQTLLGKMLRIDVAVPDGHPTGYVIPPTNPFVGNPVVLPEIWSFGLRNPWRWSFDDPLRGGTGALVIGDVGQNAWEEIDYEPSGLGGRNYGWRIREGLHPFDNSLPPFSLPLIDPIHEYPHAVGHSVTGGVVYRGGALGSDFVGRYFFADFVNNRIWSLGLNVNPNTGLATAGSLIEHTAELGPGAQQISSFGVDANGEVFLVGYGGSIYKLARGVASNGAFSSGMENWSTWATPTPAFFVGGVTNGVMEFYRQPAPPGTSNQAVVFQQTGTAVAMSTGVNVQVDLGNSSSVRKRIGVLVHDADFTDLSFCSFWLPPGSPLRTYAMRAHTTEPWSNLTVSFYAATEGFDGGFYRLDNVVVELNAGGSLTQTDCVDPTRPGASPIAYGPDLIVNGSFSTGLPPWGLWGQIESTISGGVFMFYRPPPGEPAGVVLQDTGASMTAGTIISATFDLGNNSVVRKRVTMLLHDLDFSDLAACTFWLPPGRAPGSYSIRAFTTKAWSRAAVSVYPATVGAEPWILLDNVSLASTPSRTIVGTECEEPAGPGPVPAAASAMLAPLCDSSDAACWRAWPWPPPQSTFRPRQSVRRRRARRSRRPTSTRSPQS